MGEDSRDDAFRNPAHGPRRTAGGLEAERIEYRVTYEEQCAQNRQHYFFETRARNISLDELLSEYPIQDYCPRCGGLIIGMPNRMVVDR